MLLPQLRAEVLHANQEIARLGLAVHTFGNASGIYRPGIDGPEFTGADLALPGIDGRADQPIVAIKPSGVAYASMTPADLVLTTLHGVIVEGTLNPSSDLETHLLLYREFPQIGGVVHTHSEFATAWAQSCRPIPCLGTTHADYFHGPVPVTEPLSAAEVEAGYVLNTGAVIARLFHDQHLDPRAVPGVLVAGHAPFAWGKNAAAAVEHADLLEYIARLAWRTIALDAAPAGLANHVAEHHYQRKHGPKATYGQRK